MRRLFGILVKRALVGAILATTLLTGCVSIPVLAPVAPVVDGVPGVPGWHTNLASTTCSDYSGSMTPDQKVQAAQWVLAIERRVEVSDASDGAEFAPRFATEIEAACSKYYGADPTTSMMAGAGMAYLTDPSLHPAHH